MEDAGEHTVEGGRGLRRMMEAEGECIVSFDASSKYETLDEMDSA